ncbi:MAG: hypothetical protein R3D28_21825 [Geminicoccaceae bacterium]
MATPLPMTKPMARRCRLASVFERAVGHGAGGAVEDGAERRQHVARVFEQMRQQEPGDEDQGERQGAEQEVLKAGGEAAHLALFRRGDLPQRSMVTRSMGLR